MFDSNRMGPGPKGAKPTRPAEPLVEPLLKKPTAAKILGVCPRTVDYLIAAGRLKAVKFGSSVRIDPRDLRAFIDAAKSAASDE